jgi:hypothetical protein
VAHLETNLVYIPYILESDRMASDDMVNVVIPAYQLTMDCSLNPRCLKRATAANLEIRASFKKLVNPVLT